MSMSNFNKDESTQDQIGIISMRDFLKFLRLSVNVNDTLEHKHSKSPPNFNFDQLSKNELVNNLMRKYKTISEASVPLKINDTKDEEVGKKRKKSGKAGKNISLKSKVGESCENLFPNLNPSLTEKLDEVLSQGNEKLL